MARACNWQWRLTSDPSNVLPWAWQGEAVSVNEANYRCWNLLATGPRRRRRGRGMGVVVWKMCCPARTGNAVSCGVGVVQWPCLMCVQWMLFNCGMGCRQATSD